MNDEDDEAAKQNPNKWELLFPREVKNNKIIKYVETLRRRYLGYLLSSHRLVKKKEVIVKEIETPWLRKIVKLKHGKMRFNVIRSKRK